MVTCTSCGSDVTGKKFCPHCGTAVAASYTPQLPATVCPRCNGEIHPGAAFCVHCGSAIQPQAQASQPVQPAVSSVATPATRACPACNTEVPLSCAFCTNCGSDMRGVGSAGSPVFCTQCGRQNAAGTRFCGGCGSSLIATPQSTAQPGYGAPVQYPAQPGYGAPAQYPPQPQYQQQYQQYPPAQYQQQPMMGQGPMVLRCPTCMAMAPLGSAYCVSCRTNLAGVVPTPATMPVQGQQGGLGGFLQGNGGKLAAGALGGAAAIIGGEMLMHGLENAVENGVERDMGMGYGEHHHHHRDEGLLGGLGDIANDIGL